jgi:hypothetical protein
MEVGNARRPDAFLLSRQALALKVADRVAQGRVLDKVIGDFVRVPGAFGRQLYADDFCGTMLPELLAQGVVNETTQILLPHYEGVDYELLRDGLPGKYSSVDYRYIPAQQNPWYRATHQRDAKWFSTPNARAGQGLTQGAEFVLAKVKRVG